MGLADLPSTRDASAARRATIATALVLLLTSFGSVAIGKALHHDVRVSLAHGLLAGVVGLLLWRHRTVSRTWSLVGFVVLILPVLLILWSIDSQHSAVPAVQGQKLALLAIAVLAPSSAVALVLLALFTLGWALLLDRFQLVSHPILVASGEPWVTLVYLAAALLLVGLRRQNRALERKLTAMELEAQTLREVTQVSLAIRDQLSTPLQNLELSIATMRQRHPEEAITLQRMSRSLQKLIDLRPLSEDAAELARLRALRQAGERLEHHLEAPP